MFNVEITKNAYTKARSLNVARQLEKQVGFLRTNRFHPSLKFEHYEKGIWKFRVTLHYWGMVIKQGSDNLQVYDVIKHPRKR